MFNIKTVQEEGENSSFVFIVFPSLRPNQTQEQRFIDQKERETYITQQSLSIYTYISSVSIFTTKFRLHLFLLDLSLLFHHYSNWSSALSLSFRVVIFVSWCFCLLLCLNLVYYCDCLFNFGDLCFQTLHWLAVW